MTDSDRINAGIESKKKKIQLMNVTGTEGEGRK